jgi:hypothetical protein
MGITVTKSIAAFQKAYSDARQDGTIPHQGGEGYKVARAELKAATANLFSDGKLTRNEALAYATQLSNDTVMTSYARRDAHAFLQTIGADHGLDAATVAAMKADFSVRADQGGFGWLDNVGTLVKNNLPASVQTAVKDAEAELQGAGDSKVEVRKATLAGQPALIVHSMNFDDESEKISVFTPEGKKLAAGERWDPMSGFSWS